MIDGEILSKAGQSPLHRVTLSLIAHWLVSLFGSLCVQRQDPIHIPGELGLYTEPEPDIAVTFEPTTAYLEAHPGPTDIVVVEEVSDTTIDFDLTTKAMLYSSAGVREYWVANIAGSRLIVHRGPSADGYLSTVHYKSEQLVSLEGRPSDSAVVSTFFPGDQNTIGTKLE